MTCEQQRVRAVQAAAVPVRGWLRRNYGPLFMDDELRRNIHALLKAVGELDDAVEAEALFGRGKALLGKVEVTG